MSGIFILFVYNYWIVYVGGEIKRPGKSILGSNILTTMVSGVLGRWSVLALMHVMGTRFLAVAGINEF
jgi:hypothetical protein